MLRKLIAALCFSVVLWAVEPVVYEVRFPNAVHHEAEISVTFPEVKQPVLEVRMSRSSPGRYALHEFAKNVYRVSAVDGAGKTLDIARPNPHQWNVSGHDGTVRFRYTLYGDRADGTYAAIDHSHAHLNAPAVFVWSGAYRQRPIRLRLHPPDGLGWKAATQLRATADPYVFEAPDLDYFLDSPVELSDFSEREWQVSDGGESRTIRLVVHHLGTEADVDDYERMVAAVVREEMAVFGELPAFDEGAYSFIACYLPWVNGDGMEHRNSTILTSPASLGESAKRLISTAAHEFFHAWNVERLRPRSLEPFRFDRANLSDALWFAEGFTSYYGKLILPRAGLVNLDGFAESLSGDLDLVLTSPGRRYASPVGMSQRAVFADGASFRDPVNHANTYISYYDYGAVIALALDLTLRTRFDGLSLDDYMRALWERFGRQERPYTAPDLETELARLTGDTRFAKEFFANNVYKSDLPDLAPLLARAGLLLREEDSNEASLGGVRLRFEPDGVVIGSPAIVGTPLYDAGLDRGAKILKLNGKRVRGRKVWDREWKRQKPGDTVLLSFDYRGRAGVARVRLIAATRMTLTRFESHNQPVTDEIRAFRRAWLGARVR